MDVDANPRAVIGDNVPPEPTPFDLSWAEITDLFDEAKLWMDGEPVATQAQLQVIDQQQQSLVAQDGESLDAVVGGIRIVFLKK